MTITDNQFLEGIRPEPEIETPIVAVTLHSGEVWRMGSSIPGDDAKISTVLRIFDSEEGVVVYWASTKSSDGYITSLYTMSIKQVLRQARMDVWKEALMDAVLSERAEPLACQACLAEIEDENATTCPKCGAALELEPETQAATLPAEPPVPPAPPMNGQA